MTIPHTSHLSPHWREAQDVAHLEDPHAVRHQGGYTRALLGLVALAPGAMALAAFAIGDQPISYMLGFIALVWALMLLFGFVARVFRNPRLDSVGRWMWVGFFFVAAPLALPAYWARHVFGAPNDAIQHE